MPLYISPSGGENENGKVINVCIACNLGCLFVPVNILLDYKPEGSCVVVRGSERRRVPASLTPILCPMATRSSQSRHFKIGPQSLTPESKGENNVALLKIHTISICIDNLQHFLK